MTGHLTRRRFIGAFVGTGAAGTFGGSDGSRGRRGHRGLPETTPDVIPPPETQWERTYGGGDDDWVRSVVATSDGGYVFTGVTGSTGGGGTVWLVKVDANGDEEWRRTYGGGDDRGRSVVETSDGGFLLVGWTASGGSGGIDTFLVKVDAGGTTLWERTYGGDGDDRAESVVETSDGDFLLAGDRGSYGSGGRDAWLAKVDAGGTIQWERTYGGGDDDTANAIVEASDGGYLLAGTTASSGSGGRDAWLVKVDANGDDQWKRTYGGGGDDTVESTVATSDGGYLLAGWKPDGTGDIDAWLVKVDARGTTQWEETYGGTAADRAWSVVEANDGGYLFAGDTRSEGSGGLDAWVVKVDGGGTTQWERTDGDDDTWLSVVGAENGGYLLAGATTSGGSGGLDARLRKVGKSEYATTTTESTTTATPQPTTYTTGATTSRTTTATPRTTTSTTTSPTSTGTDAAGAGGGGDDGDDGDGGGITSQGDGFPLEGLAAVGGALLVGIGGLAVWRRRSGGGPDRPAGGSTSDDHGGVSPDPGPGPDAGGDSPATPGENGSPADPPADPESSPSNADGVGAEPTAIPDPSSGGTGDAGTRSTTSNGDATSGSTADPDPSTTGTDPDESVRPGVGGGAVTGPPGPPETVPTAPSLDLTYDDLRKGDPIGGGGSADVFGATVETTEGPVTVALKEPRFHGTLHTEVVERFTREAETWAKLDDHEGVVGVVDWGAEPLPWIAMEYMDGGPLSERAGELPDDQALWTATRIADAVYHAHRHGVAHLDLKPANVLFREVEGAWSVPKVGDWGLAKLMLDHSRSVEGYSPRYAAPEQLSDDYGSPDQRTDIYAFGAVCYELFTGRPPFEGDLGRVVTQVLTDDPTPPDEVNPALPADLAGIITTAMAKRKADRYDDILRVHDDLRDLLDPR